MKTVCLSFVLILKSFERWTHFKLLQTLRILMYKLMCGYVVLMRRDGEGIFLGFRSASTPLSHLAHHKSPFSYY